MTTEDLQSRLRELRPDDEGWATSPRGITVLDRVLHQDPAVPAPKANTRVSMRFVAVVLATGCLAVAAAVGAVQLRPFEQGSVSHGPPLGFRSLQSVVAASDVTLVGKVTAIERGARNCPDIPDKDCVPWFLTVRVQDQISGPATGQMIDVLLAATASENPRARFAHRDRLILFLSEDLGGYHAPSVYVGQWRITGDGKVHTDVSDPVSRSVNGEAWLDVRRRIEAAVASQPTLK